MQLWDTFFVIFLEMIELSQSLQGFVLPLPALIVAGLLLAIASNRHRAAGLPWQSPSPKSFKPSPPNSPTLTENAPSSSPIPTSPSSSPRPSPQLPHLTPPKLSSQHSISFTIRKPEQNP
ncbi:MAG: hypothetical protein HC899_04825 [Leptolyngbyaceae cyanobacterium SM1_4_3]|nr:hypothetical protein [Leptolyngbyaceae cyanobacterium SM1_4_3]